MAFAAFMPSRVRANQVGLARREHGQHVEQQPPDRVGRIVHGRAERELDLTGGELVGDRTSVGQRPRPPIELRDHQRVTDAARRQALGAAPAVTMRPGQAVVDVDALRVDADGLKGVALGGQVLASVETRA
jgi:hypothetical protein